MPLKMNVGLTRKVGEPNYSSRGASVNIELELDSGLVNEPQKLKDRIGQMFSLVRTSLAEELNGNGNGNGHATAPANGNGNGNGHDKPEQAPAKNPNRPATQSQIKAIFGICKSKNYDMTQILHDRCNVGRPDDLTITQASDLISYLKNGE